MSQSSSSLMEAQSSPLQAGEDQQGASVSGSQDQRVNSQVKESRQGIDTHFQRV